ncbi:hypothetical protein L1987_81590 [Smallanthus sonchifolius]|uniref:Uncharacterized protein n=1 Tax=Smallanthus sonchifolius TaxID=185202 RepID=A0ACB8YQV3_9ASTR|nr:hypothetical protein L1987_81590 [Smallanthus sonchifolius]
MMKDLDFIIFTWCRFDQSPVSHHALTPPQGSVPGVIGLCGRWSRPYYRHTKKADFISPPAAHCILSPITSLGIISCLRFFFSRFHFLIAKEQNCEF